jgi:paraquat-inducible protein B
MSEYREEENEREQEETQATVRTAKFSPWVWVIPVVAIIFVGWLIVRYGFMGGGDVTVRFVEARGLDRYSPVRFRGAKVGTVQKITINENLREVLVSITMDASMTHALRAGTRFWIVEPGIEGGGLGGLLSGTYVAVAPGDGEETTEFVGQEYPPVMGAPEAGRTYILEGEGTGSITIGSPVHFEGMRVGRVLGSEYDVKRGVTSVHVFVVQRFQNHVRQSTRFYRGGGLSLSLGGGGVSVGDASLSTLLNPPISFYTPDVMAGVPVAEKTRFELHNSRAAAIAASDGPHLTYLAYFPGPIGGLAPGTPVQMKGVQVGRVRDVRLRYLPQTQSLETPVTIEIDPRRLEMQVTDAMTRDELRSNMNDALGALVRKGYRATLATSLVLPGASAVLIENVGSAGSARLVVENDPPIIPAAPVTDGLGGAMAAVGDIANTIKNLPLREIAADIRSTAARLDAIVNDPRLDQSLDRLNNALAQMESVATKANRNADPIIDSVRNAADSAASAAKTIDSAATTASQNIEPIVASLRNAAASAEGAAKRAEGLLGTGPKQNYDIAELVRELTRAAEAVRSLANFLTENPESLIRGRRE